MWEMQESCTLLNLVYADRAAPHFCCVDMLRMLRGDPG